jgi:hypothetical protein
MNEEIMKKAGFGEHIKRIKGGRCPICDKKIEGFRDSLSLKEYNISGLCQECQDNIFGK